MTPRTSPQSSTCSVRACAACRRPLASHPERFHEERSDIAHDIADLARRVSPRNRPRSGVTVDVSEIRRGRIITTGQVVNGRRIVVQKRRPFAVYVGQQPVKPD